MAKHLTEHEKEELGCVFASIILNEEKAEITAEHITAITKAAGLHVQPFWPAVFARILADKNIDDVIVNAGAAPAAAAPAAAAAAAGEAKEEKEEKKEEKKEEEEEEEGDFGLDLFG